MSKSKRLHLSYERMVLLVSGAPAYVESGSVNPLSLQRLQDISYSFNYNAQQLREIGSYEYIKDRDFSGSRIPIISQPIVDLSFSYLLYDAFNEEQIGFHLGPEGIFSGTSPLYNAPVFDNNPGAIAAKGDVNFFILAESDHHRSDIVGRIDSKPFQNLDLIGLGNCYLNSYNISASVGSFVNCSLGYACSNMTLDVFDHDNLPESPAVSVTGERSSQLVDLPVEQIKNQVEYPNAEKSILALRPGDLELTLRNNKISSDGGFNLIDLNADGVAVQSIDISINIERKDINGLGSNYINDRKMQFPILCGLSMTVLAQDYAGKKSIEDIFRDDVDFDVELNMYIRETLRLKSPKVKILIKSAKLNSESHSINIGNFYEAQIDFVFEVTPFGGFSIELVESEV